MLGVGKMSVEVEDTVLSTGNDTSTFSPAHFKAVVKQENEVSAESGINVTGTSSNAQLQQTGTQGRFGGCVPEVRCQKTRIKVKDNILSVDQDTLSFNAHDFVAVVKSENEGGINETGNPAHFFKSTKGLTKEIKSESFDTNSTDYSSQDECVSSYARSSPVAECDVIIKKEEDFDAEDDSVHANVESNVELSPKNQENFKCDTKLFQSTVFYSEVNEGSVWGLCEEGCNGWPATDKPLVELEKSESHFETDERPYCCTDCPANFKHKGSLLNHLNMHTNKRAFSCTHCPAEFNRKSILNNHLSTHTNEKALACLYCPEKFKRNSHLKHHLKNTHPDEKLFICTRCPVKFYKNDDFKSHLRTHKAEKRFSCPHCPAKFVRKYSLTVHLRVHTGEKPFLCKICPAAFRNSSNLIQHMRIHNNEKAFSCTYCSAKFRQYGHLKDHLRIHTDEKPFVCTYCPAKFNRNYSLKVHLKSHTNEKPFLCTHCPAKFSQKCRLQRHLNLHEKPFSCTHCPAKFSTKFKLTSHLTIHTEGNSFVCTHCQASFSLKGRLKNHLKTHVG